MTNPAIEIPEKPPSAIMLQLGGVYAIWLREVKRAIRDRGQLIGGVSRPLLWVLIMGIGLNPYFRGEIYGEVRFVVPYTYLQFIFPAVILLKSSGDAFAESFLARYGSRIRKLIVEEPSLESVFLSLTGRDLRDQAAGARELTYEFGKRGGEHTK